MHSLVRQHFREFSEPLEGCVEYMYLDVKGLVTVGVGCLIDPMSEAVTLPFRFKISKHPAKRNEIVDEWKRVKQRTDLATKGHRAAATVTNLELPEQAIQDLLDTRLNQMEAGVLRLPQLRRWIAMPPEAQMAILSMAWALGVRGVSLFSKCLNAVEAQDFARAAAECAIDTKGNAGIVPRNAKNKRLFLAAAETLDVLKGRTAA
jgi:GH24 family phage-related lysozyme (muramidase)